MLQQRTALSFKASEQKKDTRSHAVVTLSGIMHSFLSASQRGEPMSNSMPN